MPSTAIALEAGAYTVVDIERGDYARVRELCDRHFGLLRPRHRDSIELLPA